jgi:hypothetical protein
VTAVPDFMFESKGVEHGTVTFHDGPQPPFVERPAFVPGVFDGMPAEQYFAVEALSQSGATKLLRSPAHYKLDRDKRSEPTAAMQFGTAVHTGVLEPDRFAATVVAAPKVDRRTNAGKAEWSAFVESSVGRIVLDRADYDAARRCVDAVLAHPGARALLDGARREVSAFWLDPKYNIPCKARFDALNHGGIVDVKTTDDASPDAFARSIAKWGYHRQSAHYSDGHEVALGTPSAFFALIVVEKEPPHAVACYAMPDVGVLAGRREMATARARYAHCIAAGEWPAYPDTIETIALPKWLLRFDN